MAEKAAPVGVRTGLVSAIKPAYGQMWKVRMMEGYRLRKSNMATCSNMPGCGGNPLVCGECDGTTEEVRAKWQAMRDEWKIIRQRFWKFLENFAAETEQEYENRRDRRR